MMSGTAFFIKEEFKTNMHAQQQYTQHLSRKKKNFLFVYKLKKYECYIPWTCTVDNPLKNSLPVLLKYTKYS